MGSGTYSIDLFTHIVSWSVNTLKSKSFNEAPPPIIKTVSEFFFENISEIFAVCVSPLGTPYSVVLLLRRSFIIACFLAPIWLGSFLTVDSVIIFLSGLINLCPGPVRLIDMS